MFSQLSMIIIPINAIIPLRQLKAGYSKSFYKYAKNWNVDQEKVA